MMSSRVFWA